MLVKSTWHPLTSLCNSYPSYCWHIICVLNPKSTGWWQSAKQGGISKSVFHLSWIGGFLPTFSVPWPWSGLLETGDSLRNDAAGIVWPRDHPVTHWPGIMPKKLFFSFWKVFFIQIWFYEIKIRDCYSLEKLKIKGNT